MKTLKNNSNLNKIMVWKLNCFVIFALISIFSWACNAVEDKVHDNRNDNYKTILSGNWIKNTYLRNLKLTKSPFKSYEFTKGITAFKIDTANNMGDTIFANVSLNNHEGNDIKIILKKDKYNFFPIIADGISIYEKYKLTYKITSIDTILLISIFSKNDKLLEVNEYKKVGQFEENTELENIINSIAKNEIFYGKYNLFDSIGNISNALVHFEKNGKITGFQNFKTFNIMTDYSVQQDSFNYISFFTSENPNSENKSFNLCFETSPEGNIIFFKLKSNYDKSIDEDILSIDKVYYKLIKVK